MFLRTTFLACLALLVVTLRAQDNWIAFPQSETTENLWSIASGSRTLVVAGEHGAIISYSYEDQVWLPRYSGTNVWLVGAGFGAGRFIIVGDAGTILTSDDAGVTWTPRTSGTTTRLNSVAYGNGRWLIVGEQGSVLTSTDGTTWTARPSLGTGFLRALAFGQGRFLIGGAGGKLFSTTDASTFTPEAITTTADIEGAAISAGHFWVVGSGGLRASTTQLGAWIIGGPGFATPTLRGVAVRNLDEASAIGESTADNYLLTPTPGWRNYIDPPPFLATAVVQGENEMVGVGFGGRVVRSQMKSPAVLSSDTGTLAVYQSDVHLSVTSGQPLLSHQWLRNNVAIPGATQASLTIPHVGPADQADYTVRVTTAGGTEPFTVGGYTLFPIPRGRPEVRDPTFSSALTVLPTIAVTQPDGKVLVAGAGTVTTSRGPVRGLARLNVDGSIDSSFYPGEGLPTIQTISALHLLPDGRIYVRGGFTSISGQPRAGLARLLADGTVDPSFVPDATLANVNSSAVAPNGTLYVGVPDGIARVTATGARDPAFSLPGVFPIVDVDSRGRILALKGQLTGIGVERRIYRYLADGSLDPSYTSFNTTYNPIGWGSLFNSPLLTDAGLYFSGNYIGGHFGTVTTFSRLAPDGGPDPAYKTPPQSDYPAMSPFAYAFRPDGGLWQIRGTSLGQVNRAYSFSPDGTADRSRYATLPDFRYYQILSVAADGTMLAYRYPLSNYNYTVTGSQAVDFFRLRPLSGRVGRLTNLSVRAFVPSGDDPLIAGFVTAGTGSTSAVVRAIGPGLAGFGVTDAMRDPTLTIVRDNVPQASNDDWAAALAPRFSTVGAFPLTAGSSDAALELAIGPGNYSAVGAPSGAGSGTALVELFESAGSATPARRFVNVSARARVTPERPLIVGFSISGEVPVTVLIRGIGPTLASFGVAGVLADPKLVLYRDNLALWENTGWNVPFSPLAVEISPRDAATRTGAFALKDTTVDSAMVITLPPGTYSAVVTSATSASGTALVEVYEVP